MTDDKSNFWNEAGKAGLILGAIPVAYFLLSLLLTKFHIPFLSGLLSFLLWGTKLWLCIAFLHSCLKKYAPSTGLNRQATFRFGMAIAFLSALVYSAFYFAYVLFINPDFFSQTFQSLSEAYSSILSSEQLDQMLNMESSMPTITFFVNLFWCTLFGTIVSAISSSRICGGDDPFRDE